MNVLNDEKYQPQPVLDLCEFKVLILKTLQRYVCLHWAKKEDLYLLISHFALPPPSETRYISTQVKK